jgi:threonine/homoserine/homoserine lactone efflux protein
MELVNFVATVILITASGALAPGPLFIASISHGARSGAKSGLMFSVAHSIVEFSLVMLLAMGLITLPETPAVKSTFGLVGGVVLLVVGILQIRDSLKPASKEAEARETGKRNLLLLGFAFTGLNPFFIVWWLTVGANLILISLEFGSIAWVLFMYLCHVWMDYAWLIAISHFAKIGMNIAGFRWYRALVGVFGIILIYFGIIFIKNTIAF